MTDTQTSPRLVQTEGEFNELEALRLEFVDSITPMTEDEVTRLVSELAPTATQRRLIEHFGLHLACLKQLLFTVLDEETYPLVSTLVSLDPVHAHSLVFASVVGTSERLQEADNKVVELEAKVAELEEQLAAA